MTQELAIESGERGRAGTANSAFSLNGATLVRFLRGYASGAGLEYAVALTNRALCERYALQIIQIHMVPPGESLAPNSVNLGKGRLTNIPLPREILPDDEPDDGLQFISSLAEGCKRVIRDKVLFNPLTGPAFARWGARHPRYRAGDVPGVGGKMREIFQRHSVDCVLVHAAGGSDAWEAIHEAQIAGLPTAIQLHFSNERLRDYSVRCQVEMVDGVGGVSGVDVPSYVEKRFTNLLTAADLEFFSRARAGQFSIAFRRPVLALPARLVPTKGHQDLIEAVKLLRKWGFPVEVVFAGRADQPEYEQALRRQIADAGLSDEFHFVGLLNPAGLRDLYAASKVLAFPTYHQEGLPQILIEAQAMELPVVVYDSGGSRAGLVQGETGFVVKQGDVSGFAAAIRNLLQNESLRASVALSGRRFVEREFGLSALADRHERFIARTVEIGRRQALNRGPA